MRPIDYFGDPAVQHEQRGGGKMAQAARKAREEPSNTAANATSVKQINIRNGMYLQSRYYWSNDQFKGFLEISFA
jgi:hypothetical protein